MRCKSMSIAWNMHVEVSQLNNVDTEALKIRAKYELYSDTGRLRRVPIHVFFHQHLGATTCNNPPFLSVHCRGRLRVKRLLRSVTFSPNPTRSPRGPAACGDAPSESKFSPNLTRLLRGLTTHRAPLAEGFFSFPSSHPLACGALFKREGDQNDKV
ncbi:hypothetical protein BDP27DRAFT_1023726 [Rhodocollybia butyracea]|uniref:Uncharacterized protein n=1 Tax=Rhodocollybia butyracea TaxID=206335 RepID=A0A9P5PIX0_9AGAR|nr:hypothetical protein BDP27DRAFT_1023726 [Rhodocollybia butyracea]